MFRFLQPLSFLTASSTSDITNVTNSVTDLSEAISNYGVAVVIMAVFFVIFIILIILLLRSNAKMMDQIISNNQSSNQLDQKIISKVVDSALDAKGLGSDDIIKTLSTELKESLQPIEKRINELNNDDISSKNEDYHKDLVGAYIDINMAFKDISRLTLTNLNCNRIGIYIFHNGNKSMHGLPFFKMSCIHEWTSHGTNTLRGKSHMDMPLHLFNDFIENLYESGVYKAENVENAIKNDPSIKEFVAFSDIKALYLVAIKDNDNALTGFVATEFDKVDTFEHDEVRNKHVKDIIDNMVSKVAPIVGNKYIYNRHNQK